LVNNKVNQLYFYLINNNTGPWVCMVSHLLFYDSEGLLCTLLMVQIS